MELGMDRFLFCPLASLAPWSSNGQTVSFGGLRTDATNGQIDWVSCMPSPNRQRFKPIVLAAINWRPHRRTLRVVLERYRRCARRSPGLL
jgi:hypothetical protein